MQRAYITVVTAALIGWFVGIIAPLAVVKVTVSAIDTLINALRSIL